MQSFYSTPLFSTFQRKYKKVLLMIPAILNLNRASCCALLRGSNALNMNSVLQRGDESCVCVFPKPAWRMEELCMFQDSRLRHKGQLHLIRRTALCCGAVDEL